MATVQNTAAPAASEVLPPAPCSPDALLGMTWWNRITRAQRAHWLDVAGSFVPADAWQAFKRQGEKS